MKSFDPLQPPERQRVLSILNEAARAVFPELLIPLDQVNGAMLNHRVLSTFRPDLLPAEVIQASILAENDFDPELAACDALRDYLFRSEKRLAGMNSWLRERIGPTLEELSRIDRNCFRTLWNRLLRSQALIGTKPSDLLFMLAEDFSSPDIDGRDTVFVDLLVFNRVRCWPQPLPPSEAYAVRQVLELALATGSLPTDRILAWALRVGDFHLAKEMLTHRQAGSGPEVNAAAEIEQFNCLTAHLEGLILHLDGYLAGYLDALEEREEAYFDLHPKQIQDIFGDGVRWPSLQDLQALAARAMNLQDAEDKGPKKKRDLQALASHSVNPRGQANWRLEVMHQSVEMYLRLHQDTYAALCSVLPAMFYLDGATFRSKDGQRLMEQVARWLCYWVCCEHRYGERQANHDPDKVASYHLLCLVVTAWHELCNRPPVELLRRCRELLSTEPAGNWHSQEGLSKEPFRRSDFLLPLWLLELRALRLHGRGSPEWSEANRLATERLGFIACRVNLPDFWSGEPGFVLLTLEALGQLAVARTELPEAGSWDSEMLRCAQQILVRLEMLDDVRVRRALSGFVYPVLTSLAAWRSRASPDPLDALCLFEMARSRWLMDHLALGNRTLRVRPGEDVGIRELKDRLFRVLSPVVQVNQLSVWQDVPDDLMEELQRQSPDLARLVATSWLHPAGVRRHIPPGVVVLAYHLVHDPAIPPRICLVPAGDPWPQEEPGDNAAVWMFLFHDGVCHSRRCDVSVEALAKQLGHLSYYKDRGLANGEWKWSEDDTRNYQDHLAQLAKSLLHPWEEAGLLPSREFPLLIAPSWKLFELPWPALPRRCDHLLIDFATIGVMPSLGLTLWFSKPPPVTEEAIRVEVFLQAVPQPPTGLCLPDDFLRWLRAQPVRLHEQEQATPQRALEAFRGCEALVFLCHGKVVGTPFLELAPPDSRGRLTVYDLEAMDPADRVKVVLLGACWTGLQVQHAADEVDGMASMLLLKGVRAVLAGIGLIPVDLIARATEAIVAESRISGAMADPAGPLRTAVLRWREELRQRAIQDGRESTHPSHWAALIFYGVPWASLEPGQG